MKRKAEIDFEKAERAYARGIDNYDTQIQQGTAKMQEVRAELTKAQNK